MTNKNGQYRSKCYKAGIITYHALEDFDNDGYESTKHYYFRADNPIEASKIIMFLMKQDVNSSRFELEEIRNEILVPSYVDKILSENSDE